MTPNDQARLPDLPACHTFQHPERLYTAAQLRAYATEAIRQAANAIFAEGWYLACDWASRDDLKFDIDSPAFEADRAARLGNLLTQPEQNSDP